MENALNLRILVIDDNPAIHQDFKKILAASSHSKGRSLKFEDLRKKIFGNGSPSQDIELPKFQIDTASQGQEGVQCIKQALAEERPYALVFVDIRMPPGWDGIETIKHILELDKDIQIVICTAFSDYTWEETVQNLGMTDNLLIIKKPFDTIAVRQLAWALTKKWQLMKEAKIRADILEQTVLERTSSLQKSLSLIRATLDSSSNGIIVVDNADNVVDYNKIFIEMWNIPQSVIETRDYKQIEKFILSQHKNQNAFLEFTHYFKSNMNKSSDIILRLNDERVFECYSQPHKLEDVIVGRVWSYRDISKRVYLEEQLAYQATHDPLTTLPNRALLMDRLQQEIAQAKRNNTSFAVIFVDLDRFKLINDSLSHEAGDEILLNVSSRLRAVTRETDTISRLSGDEFILVSLIPLGANQDGIIKIASKILSTISGTVEVANRSISITASLGISIYPQDGSSSAELLRSADLAMYHAKALGGNQFHFYSATLNDQSKLRLERETDMRQALINNEFFLLYQPQIDINKKIIAVESLIRWQHPKEGVLLPLDFIPIAEDTGMIVPLGEWVLKTACKQNKEWQMKGLPPFHIAVNLSTKQFMQPNIVTTIENILRETDLEPKYLEVEVTENVLIGNSVVIDAIIELKKIGVRIALDDFGMGHASLNCLRHMPIDQVKIDQTFVKNINSNHTDEAIIQAIITMANSLSMEVIAEGVENQNQLNFLSTHNCNKFQGYLFSKAISADQFEEFLKNYKP